MRIVIAGGTGFIGGKLVAALRERGDDVTVLSRQPGSAKYGEKQVEWQPNAPAERASWMNEIDGADAVINLAGGSVAEKKWTPERIALLSASRLASTEKLCAAIEHAEKKPRVLVNASAVGFYGGTQSAAVLDETSPAGTDTLARICIDWEGTAERASKHTRVCIARIGVVFGDGGALAKMVPGFRAFVGGPIGSGHQYLSWIHVDDTVRALIFAVDESVLRGPFNVCAPVPVTMNELARALGEVLKRPHFVRVPAFVLRAAMGEMSTIVLNGQRCVPSKLLELGFEFLHGDLIEALQSVCKRSVA